VGGISINDFICAAKVDARPPLSSSARPGPRRPPRDRRDPKASPLCHPRGKKSELVVGDRCAGSHRRRRRGRALEPRRNLLFRQDEWRTKSFAANLDQLLVLVAGEPMFSESQLTRALIARSGRHPGADRLNKTDLPSAAAARERLAPYRAMGVPVLETGAQGRPDPSRALLPPCWPAARRWCSAPAAWARAR
jgi:ribosome biogenesis GTPase